MATTDNTSLTKARQVKNDEFYTRYIDIEKELYHYQTYLKERIIYCNTDNEKSNFYKFFKTNFKLMQLKKVIFTHYKPFNLFNSDNYKNYKIELTLETKCMGNECKVIEKRTPIYSDGDYLHQSKELKECDVVITNPPFSLFREFILKMLKLKKKFLIVGPLNAVHYRRIFPYIATGFVGPGVNRIDGFIDSDGSPLNPSAVWFTNINYTNRYKKYWPLVYDFDLKKDYKKYDNYDAYDIPQMKKLPDTNATIGLPINFFYKYNPLQLKLIAPVAPRMGGREMYERILAKLINRPFVTLQENDDKKN